MKDFLKYKIRNIFLPTTFMLSLLYVAVTCDKSISIFNPEFYLKNADVFGTFWCFIAVFLGIIGVLHI